MRPPSMDSHKVRVTLATHGIELTNLDVIWVLVRAAGFALTLPTRPNYPQVPKRNQRMVLKSSRDCNHDGSNTR